MSGYKCEDCGNSDIRMIVRHGSYILMCPKCGCGPATSFLSVAPYLRGRYRAAIVDEDFEESEFLAEGSGPLFFNIVRSTAHTGKRVQITRIAE